MRLENIYRESAPWRGRPSYIWTVVIRDDDGSVLLCQSTVTFTGPWG